MTLALKHHGVVQEILNLSSEMKPTRRRSMRDFACQEIVLPDGPYEGETLKQCFQPAHFLYIDLLDTWQWQRNFLAAPTQSGKTLSGAIIPLMYHLFELGENVLFGVPMIDMAEDKWKVDILPVLESSKFERFLPRRGAGSRGGFDKLMCFGNGSKLRFMGAGGDDKTRSAFTTRTLVVTEVDGFDEVGAQSREADKFTQLEGRVRAFIKFGFRLYGECTVSIERGRIWREYQEGTKTGVVLLCHACKKWVRLERNSLNGWKEANSEKEAERRAYLCCPECGVVWDESQWEEANQNAQCFHENDPQETNTLSMRYDALNNLFTSPGLIGGEEYMAAHADDEEAAEKEMLQFVWALPHKPPKVDQVPLTAGAIRQRVDDWPRGIVPASADFLITTIDLGKWLAHWITQAWWMNGRSHIVDYGRFDIPSDDLAVEAGTLVALRDFRDETILKGWLRQGHEALVPHLVWVDSGYPESQLAVYQFCNESGNDRFRPVKGQGAAQRSKYYKPKKESDTVKFIGQEYHFSWQNAHGLFLILINSDHWKSFAHERLGSSKDSSSALTLFRSADANEHIAISKHFTAEKRTEEFKPGKGEITKWIPKRKANHWFDCEYMNCTAAHFCGVRVIKSDEANDAPAKKRIIKGFKSLYSK